MSTVVFKNTLSEEAFEGKSVNVGCGEIFVAYSHVTNYAKTLSELTRKELGFGSFQEWLQSQTEVPKDAIKKSTWTAFKESEEELSKIAFIRECVLEWDIKDIDGNDVDINEKESILLEDNQKMALAELMAVATNHINYLEILKKKEFDSIKKR